MTTPNTTPLLVDISAIARGAGVGQNAVSNWRKRYENFPKPVREGAGGLLFDAEQVERWLIARGKSSGAFSASSMFPSLLEKLRSAGLDGERSVGFLLALLKVIRLRNQGDSDQQVALGRMWNVWNGDAEPSQAWIVAREAAAAVDQPELAARLLDELRPVEMLPPAVRSEAVALVERATTATDDKELLGELFESLRSRQGGHARFAEEFNSPSAVNRLFAGLARDVRSVFDLSCGEGGTLLAVAQAVAARTGVKPRLCGWDLHAESIRGAEDRLWIHDFQATLRTLDTFQQPPDHEQFDMVVADAPFGIRMDRRDYISDPDRWKYGAPPASSANMAWLQLAIERLTPQGRAYVVLDGRSTGAVAEASIRRNLLDSGVVSAIVELPGRLYAKTAIGAVLWCLRAEPSPETGRRVLLVDASSLGSLGRTQVTLDDAEIEKLTEILKMWEDRGEMSTLTETDKIAAVVVDPDQFDENAVLDPRRFLQPPPSNVNERHAEQKAAVEAVLRAEAAARQSLASLMAELKENQ